MSEGNGWNEWQNHVLSELVRLSAGVDNLRDDNTGEHQGLHEKVSELKADIAALKIKAGMWGALAGLIPALAILLWKMFDKVLPT